MNKKGFTLIELLAVILILGIIALIAIPAVNDIINDSKVGAEAATINNIVSAYENYYQLKTLKGETVDTRLGVSSTDVIAETLNINGDLNKNFLNLYLDAKGNAFVVYSTGSITCSNVDKDDATKTTNGECWNGTQPSSSKVTATVATPSA